MKRLLAILLVLTIGPLILNGCTASKDTEDIAASVTTPPAQTASPSESTPTPAPTPTPEPTGGIVYMYVDTNADGVQHVQLTCIDPTTGASSALASFLVPSSCEIAFIPIFSDMPFAEGSFSGRFSSDFTKLAASYSLPGTTEQHAGWLDEAGSFHDVTAALGLQAGDGFSDAIPEYAALGFTPDDELIYVDYNSEASWTYYAVSSDQVSPERIVTIGDIDDMLMAFGTPPDMYSILAHARTGNYSFAISDQIAGYRYLATFERAHSFHGGVKPEIAIIEFDDQGEITRTDCIPDAERLTWSATLSPDGSQIAFLSCPDDGSYSDRKTELFVTSIDGGEPIKVPCELPKTEYHDQKSGIFTMASAYTDEAQHYAGLVGWI